MGAVYEVVDEKISSRRALKVMLPSLVGDEGLRARFALEARVVGDIESEHIVHISDAGVDEATGTPFIVMDLLRGEDLASLVRRRRVLTFAEAVAYLFQAALGLDKTHAAGVVHRDLKPENLFITHRDDGSTCLKILDFGIAKVLAQPSVLYSTTVMMGTPGYMSPEQIKNRPLGPATDIYALGHIAYTLIVGELYWADEIQRGSAYLLVADIMHGISELPSVRAPRRRRIALPAAFDAWFLKATALSPQDRWDRASTAVRALTEALGLFSPSSLDSTRDFGSPAKARDPLELPLLEEPQALPPEPIDPPWVARQTQAAPRTILEPARVSDTIASIEKTLIWTDAALAAPAPEGSPTDSTEVMAEAPTDAPDEMAKEPGKGE
jgi:serine/threonine-protein kinase